MRTFSNLFIINRYIRKLEKIDIGYRTIWIFTTDHPESEYLETIFYSVPIRSLLIWAANTFHTTFYWTNTNLILEDSGLDFILNDFQEDLIILIDKIDNISLTI